MAEITERGIPRSEVIWELDDQFRFPPGERSISGAGRIEIDYDNCITQAHTYRMEPEAGPSQFVQWTHNLPIPSKRYLKIILILSQQGMEIYDYFEIDYILQTIGWSRQYLIRFYMTGRKITYSPQGGGWVTLTENAPRFGERQGTEIEIFIDIEKKRLEAIRIGNERYKVGAPIQESANPSAVTRAILQMIYTKTSANAGKIWIDRIQIIQS